MSSFECPVHVVDFLDAPGSLPILNEALRPRGYHLQELTPPTSLFGNALHIITNPIHREACSNYLATSIQALRQRNFVQTGTHLHDDKVVELIPQLVDKFMSGDISLVNPDAGIGSGQSQLKNKSNKEQGILQFIVLCQDSKTIMSSVDMYNNYRRWVNLQGYGCCSAPTLTKYLRDSDKKQYESLSEKGRSQGWYLSTPL